MAAFGTGFLFPVVLVAMQMIGIVTPKQLSSWRRQTALVIVIIAAAITPSGDPVSLAALAVPMYIFYEIAVLLGRLLVRRRDRAAAAPDGAAV